MPWTESGRGRQLRLRAGRCPLERRCPLEQCRDLLFATTPGCLELPDDHRQTEPEKIPCIQPALSLISGRGVWLIFGSLFNTVASGLNCCIPLPKMGIVCCLELQARQLEEERARRQVVQARLSSLESRIRPHFLFNTLAALHGEYSRRSRGPRTAPAYTTKSGRELHQACGLGEPPKKVLA